MASSNPKGASEIANVKVKRDLAAARKEIYLWGFDDVSPQEIGTLLLDAELEIVRLEETLMRGLCDCGGNHWAETCPYRGLAA